ncbi:glutaredoxin family protein [Nesterenkonia sandarakina]|uniref:Glutaredoxin n=1 Tax=Nesterenkonia sandarakina TaxID=272918 RepID=A0A7Z0E736_9MICC|nr:glutaredoxin family protein [Nesterenkonia sandarakina]NYJ16089.1 glutaredoxin [Nesterenkonia sandarakina]
MGHTVEVELLTKQGCHLCEEAVAVTREACAEFSVTFIEHDITEDATLLASFAEEIPVLRIDGRVRDFWRIDPQRLRRLLREATAGS